MHIHKDSHLIDYYQVPSKRGEFILCPNPLNVFLYYVFDGKSGTFVAFAVVVVVILHVQNKINQSKLRPCAIFITLETTLLSW